MIIKSINITEGFFNRKIKFQDGINLIFSKKNSCGKTTLLRFLLYSLGYNIPNTKNIKFELCEVETIINTEYLGDITLNRSSKNSISANINGEEYTYILPSELNKLHSIIYHTDNNNLLDNILGTIYVDQEKGWTLLNRGIVIGSLRFNIEDLIRGLSNIDCDSLIAKESQLARELNKYKQMFSVSQYQKSIETETEVLFSEDYDERLETNIQELTIQKNILKKEINRVSNTIKKNKQFKKYIEEMKILIKAPNGDTIPVTSDNIVGFDDNTNYLVSKHKMLVAELSTLLNEIEKLESQRKYDEEQVAFLESETLTQSFDRKISTLQLSAPSIQSEIKRLEKELKNIRKEISNKTRSNTEVIDSLYTNVNKYLTELKVNDDKKIDFTYLFTSNLKELSGAVLHKTVFAFKLAYILEVEKALKIKLPIILDSPSGKEVDQSNVQLMMDILKRDFSANQIIIASIFTYKFDSPNIITINNKLIENMVDL